MITPTDRIYSSKCIGCYTPKIHTPVVCESCVNFQSQQLSYDPHRRVYYEDLSVYQVPLKIRQEEKRIEQADHNSKKLERAREIISAEHLRRKHSNKHIEELLDVISEVVNDSVDISTTFSRGFFLSQIKSESNLIKESLFDSIKTDVINKLEESIINRLNDTITGWFEAKKAEIKQEIKQEILNELKEDTKKHEDTTFG